jgi:hypothetical protein
MSSPVTVRPCGGNPLSPRFRGCIGPLPQPSARNTEKTTAEHEKKLSLKTLGYFEILIKTQDWQLRLRGMQNFVKFIKQRTAGEESNLVFAGKFS